MYYKDKHTLDRVSLRLQPEEKEILYAAVERNQLTEGLDDGYFMGVKMVMFLKKVDYKGLLLCDVVNKMENSNLKAGEKLVIPQNEEEERIYVVADGEVFFKKDGKEVMHLKRGEVYGKLFTMEENEKYDEIESFGESVVFRVSVYDFYNVMADHHELAQRFIKNITTN